MTKFKGSCHCSSVRWEFSLPIKTVVKCHCANCRKLQGSDYSTWVIVPSDQFSISDGNENVTTYEPQGVSRKSFCSKCGSPVFLVNGKHFPDEVVLPKGNIENYTDALAPQIQVYTPDKAVWVLLHDDIECSEQEIEFVFENDS